MTENNDPTPAPDPTLPAIVFSDGRRVPLNTFMVDAQSFDDAMSDLIKPLGNATTAREEEIRRITIARCRRMRRLLFDKGGTRKRPARGAIRNYDAEGQLIDDSSYDEPLRFMLNNDRVGFTRGDYVGPSRETLITAAQAAEWGDKFLAYLNRRWSPSQFDAAVEKVRREYGSKEPYGWKSNGVIGTQFSKVRDELFGPDPKPEPELPTEPGVYTDRIGGVWTLWDGELTYRAFRAGVGIVTPAPKSADPKLFAPFTRLVPETTPDEGSAPIDESV